MSTTSTSSSGIGVTGLLGVSFVVLKLCKIINWSWWWVTAPFWGGLVLLVVGFIIYMIYHLIKKNKSVNSPYSEKYTPQKSNFQKRLEEMEKQRNSNVQNKPANDN